MRILVLLAVAAAAVAIPATAFAKGKVSFEDTVPSGKSSSTTIQTHRAAAFRVLLRAPTQGRVQLFLLGKTVPKDGPLIDTKDPFACKGAAGSFHCRASYEPLPKGTYTWRVSWVGVAKKPAHVELTVRW